MVGPVRWSVRQYQLDHPVAQSPDAVAFPLTTAEVAGINEDRASELVSRIIPRAGSIEDKHLGDELDVALDWAIGDHLSLSRVLAVFAPGKGAEQFLGDDETWVAGMQVMPPTGKELGVGDIQHIEPPRRPPEPRP